jgi:putative ATP-dependent endonuclease of OLD family
LKISFVDIKKFRSIESCKVSFSLINAIVGQNNSGKSGVIRALNAFFNPEQEELFFVQGKHDYNSKSTPKITICFDDVINNPDFKNYLNNETLEVQLSYLSSTRRLAYKYKNNNRFVTAPDDLLKAIKINIAFVFIPPNRSPDQLKWEENSLIKRLIEEYLKVETKKRDMLTPKFKSAADFLETGALKKISRDVESYYSLRHKFNFSLNFDRNANFLSFLNGIEMHIKESGVQHHLDDCGTGLQSLTIIAFHRVLAKLKHQNIILGLEEPETNLHPQAQRELINSIRKSSNDDDVSQVIITTHSTVIVDNIEHLNISLVRKYRDENRGFKSQVYKLSDTFFEDHSLEEFKYYQFHLYRNSDFFYANYVIFVESKNDAEIVKYLADIVNIDLDLYGISLVNIDGVRNLSYPFHIVKELGIPYLAILDKDYFIPYLNDDLKSSRDNQGLPKYKYEYKNSIILNDLISFPKDRDSILGFLKTNHRKALDVMDQHNLICMKYNLEMDLLCSDRAVEVMSNILGLSEEQSNRHFILTERNKASKRIDTMLDTLKVLTNSNLPSSFKRIKKKLVEISKAC